ncbi:hypothetical protein [Streptomyces sp. NPDC012888]|uniref:hypothetical protein n=1 Tax=Streptomyces sp. NPDC012888 TaxID=3364855 RepID=UPI00369B5700
MNLRRALVGLAAPALLLAAPGSAGAAAAAPAAPADPFAACASRDAYPKTRMTTELVGMPEKMTAGTWTPFTFRVKNTSNGALKAVGVQVDAGATQYAPVREDRKTVVQWWDWTARRWQPVPPGHLAFQAVPMYVKAGAVKDVKMRIQVSGGAGEALGEVIEAGRYITAGNTCGYANTMHLYPFTVAPKPAA